jgi:3-dehydrosphinganine reductase
MADWRGKAVYISGGTNGIGLAAARRFAGMGARLFLFSVDPKKQRDEALSAVRTDAADGGRKIEGARLDVTDPAAVAKGFARAQEAVGPPDVLVNSAGLGGPDYFEQISFETFDRMMRVNVYGVWNTVQAALPLMKGRGGHIVNVASLGGLIGAFGYTAYGASKFAVVGFSEALRAEVKQYGIHVMALCPPPVETPMWHRSNIKRPKETKAINAGSGLLQPEEVVDALIEGLDRRAFLVVPGRKGRFAYHLNRLLPGVRTFVTDRMIRRAQEDGTGTPK